MTGEQSAMKSMDMKSTSQSTDEAVVPVMTPDSRSISNDKNTCTAKCQENQPMKERFAHPRTRLSLPFNNAASRYSQTCDVVIGNVTRQDSNMRPADDESAAPTN